MRSDTLITGTDTDTNMRSDMTDKHGHVNYVARSDTLITDTDTGTDMRSDMTDGHGHVNYIARSTTLCIIDHDDA